MIDHNRLLAFEGVLCNVDARQRIEARLYQGLRVTTPPRSVATLLFFERKLFTKSGLMASRDFVPYAPLQQSLARYRDSLSPRYDISVLFLTGSILIAVAYRHVSSTIRVYFFR